MSRIALLEPNMDKNQANKNMQEKWESSLKENLQKMEEEANRGACFIEIDVKYGPY